MQQIREQALLLGSQRSLVGILSPAASATGAQMDAPTVVVLNSGVIHRVGAHRMTVTLARALAAAGFATLRFDLSGIGDSEARNDGLAPLDSSLADIREVLDSIEAIKPSSRFILAGLCSGADYSVLYAGSDPRVVGVVLIDPSIPRTMGYYLRLYGGRLVSHGSWLNFVRGRHRVWGFLKKKVDAPAGLPTPARQPSLESPEVRAYLERAYAKALGGGNQFLVAFTDGREDRHNYRNQLLEAFPGLEWRRQLHLAYFKDCDHTFTFERHRINLIHLVVDWVRDTTFVRRKDLVVPVFCLILGL